MKLALLLSSLCLCVCVVPTAFAGDDALPAVSDPRLKITVFAQAPDIVHPISVDFDAKGRLLVIESHTHFPPKDYQGPRHDRVRIIEDTDGDGKADHFTTFFEGTTHTMDLAVHPDGSVYLATRNEILRLRDTDGDGKADTRQRIVFLDTRGNYPHNGLSGLCFDGKNHLVFGMGENLGAGYKLIGSGGVTISGEGDGGHIFRCTTDGKKLTKVATGFWNPFGICLDRLGHVFAVENDPDAMPPCRLLHIVQGGDYGYQFRYGRSGRHPFQAWNGELPGTLPMVCGTGEGPCEVLAYEAAGLPAEYRGNLLVTSWADHRVERYVVTKKGASFAAERKPFVQGGPNFRPVGLAVAPDGSLFVSDWVLRDYTLHGKGAIWHIGAKQPGKSPGHPVQVSPQARLDNMPAAIENLEGSTNLPKLLAFFHDADPFVRHAAVQRLARQPSLLAGIDWKRISAKQERLGIVLAHRAAGSSAAVLSGFLGDPGEDVRFLAAKWVADEKLERHRAEIRSALDDPKLNVRLYWAFTTALARLEGKEVNEARLADYFFKRVSAPTIPGAARAQALRLVPASHPSLTIDFLASFFSQDDIALQREAVRALVEHPDGKRLPVLAKICSDEKLSDDIRAEAVVGLASQQGHAAVLQKLIRTGPAPVRAEALRARIKMPLSAAESKELEALAHAHPETRFLVARLLGEPFHAMRLPSKNLDGWMKLLEGPADVAAGRRIFANQNLASCVRCHRIDGRGSDIGPDLSTIGRTDPRQILASILQPSANIAPHYQAWLIETDDGKVRTGLLTRTYLDEYTYVDEKGSTFKVNTRNIVSVQPAAKSIMPDGLVNHFTDQELRDLWAFLRSRK